jgi:Tol biopolymer transport system component
MAQELQECEAHGTPTRLRCAEEGCGKPICPQCLVKTPVGLKCEEHAQAVPARFDRRVAPFALGALLLVAAAVVILAVAVLNQGDDSTQIADDTPAPAADGSADRGRIVPASVYVVNADGTQPRTLTNRPLAFDASPAWSPDGTRIAFESTIEGKRSIWVMQADGQGLRRLTDGGTQPAPGSDASPTWSPDGSRIAFMSDRDANAELYVINADGQGLRRLTEDPATDGFPAWSPDGARLAFVSDRDGELGIWAANADGTGPARLVPGPTAPGRPAWSPDGRQIAFASDRNGADLDIWVAPTTAPAAAPTRVISSPAQDGEPAWSPDGSRLAFASDRDGAPQVYVASRDGTNPVKLTNRPRSFAPAWAPDGTKLVYINDPVPGG